MTSQPHTLDDGSLARFVADGCLAVRTTLPADFHSDLYARIEEVFEKEGNPGNNLLPRLPGIGQVFDDPAVAGALESLLGPGYVMNPHRHCHLNPPGSPGQSWHKDCYVFDHNLRHPRFRWVLGFYYPQDVTADMGPTGVLPGQQWYRTISDPDPRKATEREEPLLGEAGTVAIVHFDSWHRAIANQSGRKRYMLKFQFARAAEPPASEAPDGRRSWEESGAVCSDVWRWLSGAGNGAAAGSEEPIGGWVDQLASASPAERARAADRIALSGAAADAVPALARALEDEAEPVRLNAAYALAAAEEGPGLLAGSLRREAAASEELATAKTADNAHGTNPTAPAAAHALAVTPGGDEAAAGLLGDGHWLVRASAAGALANMGPAAAPHADALCAATGDEHWWVRRNALEALGRLPDSGDQALEAATRCLRDEDYRVRRNAAIALRHAAAPAEETVPALVGMLEDENRYNRFYAADGLRRLAPVSPEAAAGLMYHLFTSRWCSLTTPDSLY